MIWKFKYFALTASHKKERKNWHVQEIRNPRLLIMIVHEGSTENGFKTCLHCSLCGRHQNELLLQIWDPLISSISKSYGAPCGGLIAVIGTIDFRPSIFWLRMNVMSLDGSKKNPPAIRTTKETFFDAFLWGFQLHEAWQGMSHSIQGDWSPKLWSFNLIEQRYFPRGRTLTVVFSPPSKPTGNGEHSMEYPNLDSVNHGEL